MNLDDIRLLQQVVKLGSMQRAAASLRIPRSTLRRRLDSLAAEVGSELFVATAAGVSVTSAGAVVLEHGAALLENSARMVASAKGASATIAGRVGVIMPVGMPTHTCMMLLEAIRQGAPDLCIEVRAYANPLEHLDEPFDLMFHFGKPPERGDWVTRALLRTRLVPVASEAYLEEAGRPKTVEDLATHPLLTWCVENITANAWPLRNGNSLFVEPVLCSSDAHMMHFAAQSGRGILLGNPEGSFLPLPTALTPVLVDEVGCEVTFRCLSPLGLRRPRIKAVLERVSELLDAVANVSG